jgi:mono/diheme cytochrome c family protein
MAMKHAVMAGGMIMAIFAGVGGLQLQPVAVGGKLVNPPAEAGSAEAPDLTKGKRVYDKVGLCITCHGWDGAGRGSDPRSPGEAANLRETELDAVGLKDVISCGIPTTQMPYHNAQAYKDPDVCYGMVMDDFGGEGAPNKGRSIRDADMDALVAYIQHAIQGAGETTKAQCEEYYAPGNRNCASLP